MDPGHNRRCFARETNHCDTDRVQSCSRKPVAGSRTSASFQSGVEQTWQQEASAACGKYYEQPTQLRGGGGIVILVTIWLLRTLSCSNFRPSTMLRHVSANEQVTIAIRCSTAAPNNRAGSLVQDRCKFLGRDKAARVVLKAGAAVLSALSKSPWSALGESSGFASPNATLAGIESGQN